MLNTKAQDINFDSHEKAYTIKTNTGTLNASLVCNSSGRKSNLEPQKKTNQIIGTNYVGVKYHVKLNRDKHLIEIHNFPGGYCGISSIEDNKSCICYIVNSEKLKKAGNSIPELENKFLFKNKNLKKIFSNAEFLFKEPITVSGINFLIKKPVSDHSFFVGDSAGSIAPITGNGMSIALRSASTLAHNIDGYFSSIITKQHLDHNYKVFWKNEFSARIKLSRHFQKLSEHPTLTNLTIGLFNVFPSLAKMMIEQTHGKPF
jgi:flavin-dependent dehydrogenase